MKKPARKPLPKLLSIDEARDAIAAARSELDLCEIENARIILRTLRREFPEDWAFSLLDQAIDDPAWVDLADVEAEVMNAINAALIDIATRHEKMQARNTASGSKPRKGNFDQAVKDEARAFAARYKCERGKAPSAEQILRHISPKLPEGTAEPSLKSIRAWVNGG